MIDSYDDNIKFNAMIEVITAQLDNYQAWQKLVAEWIIRTKDKIEVLEQRVDHLIDIIQQK